MKKILLTAAVLTMSFAAMAQSLGHVNTTEVVELMPEMDSVRVQMEAAQKETEETFIAMRDEFQAKYQQYEQKKSTWTPAILENKERELAEIQNRLQEFSQAAQQDLQELNQQLRAPIIQKAMEAIKKVATERALIYVLDAQDLIYFDPVQAVDITPDVRKELGISDDKTLEGLQQQLQARAQAAAQQM